MPKPIFKSATQVGCVTFVILLLLAVYFLMRRQPPAPGAAPAPMPGQPAGH
jgi:hypothetical protein